MSSQGHTETICDVAALPNGQILTASWDKSVRLWDQAQCVATFKGHDAAVGTATLGYRLGLLASRTRRREPCPLFIGLRRSHIGTTRPPNWTAPNECWHSPSPRVAAQI